MKQPVYWRLHIPRNHLVTIVGYSEACALGLKGMCIVPSKRLFKIMLELFRRSVNSDHVPKEGHIAGLNTGINVPMPDLYAYNTSFAAQNRYRRLDW